MDFINLQAQHKRIRKDVEVNINRVLDHGQFILGPEVVQLEESLALFSGAKYCISVANGTDALQIALMALGITHNDEVIVPAFTYIATAEAVAVLGAKPVFVDISLDSYNINVENIEAAITPRTKAIIAVSLYGQCADFDEINAIANKHHIPVVEDGAQSFGGTYKGNKSCNLSTVGCTSFFPSKPLGCFGDGGAVFTSDSNLAALIRQIARHGQESRYRHVRIGVNSRLDTLQAAILLAKLDTFLAEINGRQVAADRYKKIFDNLGSSELSSSFLGCEEICLPNIRTDCTSAWAQYTVRVNDRELVQSRFEKSNIPSAVHYPAPLYKQPVFSNMKVDPDLFPSSELASKQVLSLPLHADLTEQEQESVMKVLCSL